MHVVRRATPTRKFTLPEVVEMPPIGFLACCRCGRSLLCTTLSRQIESKVNILLPCDLDASQTTSKVNFLMRGTVPESHTGVFWLRWSNSRGVNISMRGIDLGTRPSCPSGFAMVLW